MAASALSSSPVVSEYSRPMVVASCSGRQVKQGQEQAAAQQQYHTHGSSKPMTAECEIALPRQHPQLLSPVSTATPSRTPRTSCATFRPSPSSSIDWVHCAHSQNASAYSPFSCASLQVRARRCSAAQQAAGHGNGLKPRVWPRLLRKFGWQAHDRRQQRQPEQDMEPYLRARCRLLAACSFNSTCSVKEGQAWGGVGVEGCSRFSTSCCCCCT